MLIKCDRKGEGRKMTATLEWQYEKEKYSLFFPYNVSYVYSEALKKIYVSAYAERKILLYFLDAILDSEFLIPQKEHYQYRGLNANKNSATGVTMLYVPLSDSVGNEWGDIEQYELLDGDPILGEKIAIWR